MKINILSIFALTCITSQAAVTVTGADNFTESNNNTSITVVGDTAEFSVGDQNDQGVGIQIDTSSSLSPTNGEELFFQFDTEVTSREVQFFYGNSSNFSSSAAESGDSNAFSVGIDTNGNIFARNNGTAIDFSSSFSNLDVNTQVSFSIVLRSELGQNNGTAFEYDATVNIFDPATNTIITETLFDISGNQNPANDVSNFNFFAIGTQGLSADETFTVSNFIASDTPIKLLAVPEPSSAAMLALAGSLLILRRRRVLS